MTDAGKTGLRVYQGIHNVINKIQLMHREPWVDEVVGWPRVSEVADTELAGRNGDGKAKIQKRDVLYRLEKSDGCAFSLYPAIRFDKMKIHDRINAIRWRGDIGGFIRLQIISCLWPSLLSALNGARFAALKYDAYLRVIFAENYRIRPRVICTIACRFNPVPSCTKIEAKRPRASWGSS